MPPDAGADRIEERDGKRTNLERESFAHRQVGRACRRGGEKEDAHPAGGQRLRREQVLAEQIAGQGEQDARHGIGQRDHDLAADGVEQTAEQDRSEHVARGKRQDVPAHLIGRRAVEIGQDQRVGEEDGVVEEGLCRHQGEPDQVRSAVGHEQRAGDFAKGRVVAHAQPNARRPASRRAPTPPRRRFDAAHDGLGFGDRAMGHQPAGAFRNPASHQEDDQSYRSSDQEREPPAKPRIDKGRIEQDDRAARPQRRSDPETSVDQKIGPAAQARRE